MKKVKFTQLTKIEDLCSSMSLILEQVESEIENRTDYYGKKSEKWQDSEKGIEYMDRTEQLEYCHSVAEEHIQTILDTVEELRDMQDE